ncbi:MAG: cupredoxin domain-containing protein [Halioglobus sp.]
MKRLLALFTLLFWPALSHAATPIFEIEIRGHLFQPEEIRIPENTKVKLIVYNRDSTPEEFESYELNREKVIMGGRKANIFIGPLAPGIYPFFGEFNPKTAQGRVIVE